MSIIVSIVENNERDLNHLGRLINSARGLRCSGLYSSPVSALKIFPVSPPDVVLMNINLPSMNGIEYVRRIKAACPDQLILVLTDLEDLTAIFCALTAGAVGYLLKSSSSEQIITAIHEVYHGGSPLTGSIARRMVGLFQQNPIPEGGYRKLSLREQQVLEVLALGYRYKEIAEELDISYATVHTHIRNIYKKLEVGCRTDAVTAHLRHATGWKVQTLQWQFKPVELCDQVLMPRDITRIGAL